MKMMRSVELGAHSEVPILNVVRKKIPVPTRGQVLVKVAVSPLNPADVMFTQGRYILQKPLPVIPGMVAAGDVVESGGGLAANYLKGKRVCCASLDEGDGPWSEYILTDALRCFPLSSSVSFELGCNLLANPTTAWALMDIVAQGGHGALVLNAAAGELGSFVRRIAALRGLPVINIVRTDEQKLSLLRDGCKYVLDSTGPTFPDQLVQHCNDLQATIALDAVAGEEGVQLMHCLPKGSEIVVYGRLSGQPLSFDGLEVLASNGIRISGFSVLDWFERQSIIKKYFILRQVQTLVVRNNNRLAQRQVGLSALVENFAEYSVNTSQGKTLIYPWRS